MRRLTVRVIIRLECHRDAIVHINIFTFVYVRVFITFLLFFSWSPTVRNTQRDHYWICVSLMGSDINVQWLAKIIQFYWEKPLQFTILHRRSVLVFSILFLNLAPPAWTIFWWDEGGAAKIQSGSKMMDADKFSWHLASVHHHIELEMKHSRCEPSQDF